MSPGHRFRRSLLDDPDTPVRVPLDELTDKLTEPVIREAVDDGQRVTGGRQLEDASGIHGVERLQHATIAFPGRIDPRFRVLFCSLPPVSGSVVSSRPPRCGRLAPMMPIPGGRRPERVVRETSEGGRRPPRLHPAAALRGTIIAAIDESTLSGGLDL